MMLDYLTLLNPVYPLVAVCVLALALLVDLLFGEPPWKPPYELHPINWVAKLIKALEPHFRNPNPTQERLNGILLVLIVTLTIVFPIYFGLKLVYRLFGVFVYVIVAAIILKMTICIRDEARFAKAAARAVEAGDLAEGRRLASLFSRRDVTDLSGPQVASAIIESIAENLTDFKLSSIFYYAFLGVSGAVAFRTINTLDGMVGFKDREHIHIGWFSATLDTIVNYIPARLTAILIVLASAILGGDHRNAWEIAYRDQAKVPSVNHGWPMAAMAGALCVQLEKPGHYVIGNQIVELAPSHIMYALKIRNVAIILCIVFMLPILFLTNLFLFPY